MATWCRKPPTIAGSESDRKHQPAFSTNRRCNASESVKKVLEATQVVYPGHDRPFRVSGSGEIHYLADTPTLKFTGILDYSGSTFSIDVALAPNRGVSIHPEAQSGG